MIDEKEWQKFIVECNVYKNKVDELVNTTHQQEDRIAKLEQSNTRTDVQYTQIMEKLNKLVDVTIPALSAEIQAIKDKPGKKWESLVAGIIGAVGGGIGGAIIAMLIK